MMNKLKIYGLWALKILLALAFLGAGGSKLAGVEDMVALYDQIGFGQWFRYLTGVLEVSGALALLVPKISLYAAGLLVCIMIGAIGTHLFLIGGTFIPALVLGLLSGLVAFAEYQKNFKSNEG
ncbi:MAG: DoxX family protein [Pseudomonadota bacterium]